MNPDDSPHDPDPPADAIEPVDHTADWSFAARGRDLEELLRNTARGMGLLLLDEGYWLVPKADESRRITLEAEDAEGLLVAWMNEIAYFAERDGFIVREMEVSHLTSTSVAAVVRGGRAAEMNKHIKAVTYHDIAIRTIPDGRLEVTVVLDV
jgi:SHS2 domain-containing protein